jgi:hypothetical protein
MLAGRPQQLSFQFDEDWNTGAKPLIHRELMRRAD